jgi:hypothetical protein
MRILSVRAEPPDVRPGGLSSLSTLLVDPTNPTRRNSILYLACDPDPRNLDQNPCTQYENLESAADLFNSSTDGGINSTSADGGLNLAIAGARFIGFNDNAYYDAPADLFSALAPDDIDRTRGVLAVLLIIAVGEEIPFPPTNDQLQAVLQRIQSKQTPAVVAIKRLRITEKDVLNQNPVLNLVATDSDVLTPDHGLRVKVAQHSQLTAVASIGADENYVAIGPDGATEARTELADFSWFSTAGNFIEVRTTAGDTGQFFIAPLDTSDDPVPANRTFSLWVVVRDGRGGEDWASLSGFVCDPSLPSVQFGSASVEANNRVHISGTHLDQILDVSLGGLPLRGGYDPTTDQFLSTLLPGGSGGLPLLLRGKNCNDATGTLQVP